MVTENKTVTEEQKRDLVLALITLKYTQSNSRLLRLRRPDHRRGRRPAEPHPLHPSGGPEGRQLAAAPACDKVLELPFRDDVARPNRDNAIDVYISASTPEDVIGDDVWAETFTRQPEPLTAAEKKEYLSQVTGVCLGSDAFFPFGDNIERARRSGVTAIVPARRLHPRRAGHRHLRQVRHCHGLHAASGCSITKTVSRGT